MTNTNHESVTKNAVAYCRISTEDQSRFSIISQKELCEAKAKALGYELPQQNIFIDEGFSAKTLKRPALTSMLNFCRQRKNNIHGLIVYKIDRVSRESADYLAVRKLLGECGVSIVSCSETTGDSPSDRFVELIMAGVAQLDNELRGERVRNGMLQRIKAGLIASKAPLGYKNITLPDNRRTIIADPKSFELMKEAWEMMASGAHTLDSVARFLDSHGIQSRRGSRVWPLQKQQMSRIFSSKAYLGYAVSKKNHLEVKSDIFPAMVNEELFYQVQSVLGNRQKNKGLYQRLRPEFVLRGYLKCHCGLPMRAGYVKGRSKYYGYYFCEVHGKPSLPIETIDAAFVQLLQSITPDPLLRKMVLKDVHDKWQDSYNLRLKNEFTLQREIDDHKAMKLKIAEKNLQGVYDDDFTKEALGKVDADILALRIAQSDQKWAGYDIQAVLAFMDGFLSNIEKALVEAKHLDQKRALAGLIFPKGMVFQNSHLEPLALASCFQFFKATAQSPETFSADERT